MDDAVALPLLFAGIAAAFIVGLMAFVTARRAWPGARRGAAHALATLGALAAGGAWFVLMHIPFAWLVPGLAMVLCNSYIAFHLDNMAETARRIRILRELHASGSLTLSGILSAYPPQEVFDLRIRRLTLAGQCTEESGRLRTTGAAYSLMGTVVALGRKVVFGSARKGSEDDL